MKLEIENFVTKYNDKMIYLETTYTTGKDKL